MDYGFDLDWAFMNKKVHSAKRLSSAIEICLTYLITWSNIKRININRSGFAVCISSEILN